MQFGTDGVRGVANAELTPELALALGRAAARVVRGPRWAIGRDTRKSGPMLVAAFGAGLASEGVDVVGFGVAPTPEVAWWSSLENAPAAVVSGSHNPFGDNGIKLFSAGGLKLPDEVEAELEAELARLLAGEDESVDPPVGAGVGTLTTVSSHEGYGAAVSAHEGYRASIAASIQGRRLEGLRLVVDCANGAAIVVAPDVFESLGAEVECLHCAPDGTNINDACGSTHPAALQAAVVEADADLGVAFDGDADRVLLVDRVGRLIDGDQIIGICAIDMAARGELVDSTVVVTVMTNLGFRLGMAQQGISVVDTQVGDRYVLEALDSRGLALGGEQSGHVIFRRLATTGDGLLTAVQVLDVMVRSGLTLGELADQAMTRMPQVLRNVRVAERAPDVIGRVADEVTAVEAELGETGRVLIRPSGTEPLVRVMVEAPTEHQAGEMAERLVTAVESMRLR
jgi:phosphoglucosamine mutase